MELKIDTSCVVGKKMTTDRHKADAGGEAEIVTCTITVKGIRVSRDQMDELAGLPIGVTSQLYNELGAPYQRMSFLLPKRVLLVSGNVEHRRESGATIAKLKLTKAAAGSLRFNLDTPDEHGPTAMLSFTLMWKAAGDEIEDVKDLLAHTCFLAVTFKEENNQQPLFNDSKPSASAEKAAGERSALDRKRLAAGERATDNDETTVRLTGPGLDTGEIPASQFRKMANKVVENERAAKAAAAKGKSNVVGIGSKFEREAREKAAKHPRRDPPKGGKR